MAGRAESGQAHGLAVGQLREIERPQSDGAGAEQGRGLLWRQAGRQAMRERCRYDHPLGVAAIGVASGGSETGAEILPSRSAEIADAAGPVNPGNADPRILPVWRHARAESGDVSHHLVAE